MICKNCGFESDKDSEVCTSCGMKNVGIKIQTSKEKVGRLVFFRKYSMYKVKSSIITSSVIFYISALVYVGLALKQSNYILIDAFFCMIFGVLINILQSRVVSVISLLYSITSLGISCYYFTRISGYIVIIASISGIYGTFKFKKLWDEYKLNPDTYCKKYQKQHV